MVCFVIAIHSNWIPANPRFALPAGMTDFLVLGESFCCSVSRLKLVAKMRKQKRRPKVAVFINKKTVYQLKGRQITSFKGMLSVKS